MKQVLVNNKKKKIITPEYLKEYRNKMLFNNNDVSDYILSKEYLQELGFKMVNKNNDIEFYANVVNIQPYKTFVFEGEIYNIPRQKTKQEMIIVSLRAPNSKPFNARINIPKSIRYLQTDTVYGVITGVVYVYLFLRYYHSVKKILNSNNENPRETELIFAEFRKTAPISITIPKINPTLKDTLVALNIINKRNLAERLKNQTQL